jgi:hypothetical protein
LTREYKSCFDVSDSEKNKKNKKKTAENTVLPPTRRQKPTHESPTAAGIRQCKRSLQPKKSLRSLIERKEAN